MKKNAPMFRSLIPTLIFLVVSSAALAQAASTASESITVTAGKYSQSVIRNFVDTHVAPNVVERDGD